MANPRYEADLGNRAGELSDGELFSSAFRKLLAAQACFGFAFSGFLLLPKFLDTELQAGPFAIGSLMAVYGVVVVFWIPAMGVLVDRFGRRDFLTGGALLMAASSLAFVYVDEVGWLLYALRVAQALAFGMAFAAGAALAVDLAPAHRLGQAIGIFGLTFLSMNAIAPAAVEEISSQAGWPTAFALCSLGAVLCSILSRRIPEPRSRRRPTEPAATLWQVATRPRLLRLMLIIALVGIAMSALFVFHQPYARQIGIDNIKSFFVAYALVAVFVRGALGRFVDRAGLHRVAIGALALYVIVVVGMVALKPGWLALFGAGLGVAHGFAYPALNAIAIHGAGEDERGKVMSLFQAAFNVGFAGVALLLGMLAESSGYRAVFLVGGLSALAALVLLANSPEGRKPPG